MYQQQCFVCFQVHRFVKTKIKPWYFFFDKYDGMGFFFLLKGITLSFQPENRNVQALSDEASSVVPQLYWTCQTSNICLQLQKPEYKGMFCRWQHFHTVKIQIHHEMMVNFNLAKIKVYYMYLSSLPIQMMSYLTLFMIYLMPTVFLLLHV